jgi:hypothetical protein
MQQVCLDKIQQWFDAGRFEEARRLLYHLIGYDRCQQDLKRTNDPIPQHLQDWAVRLEKAIAAQPEKRLVQVEPPVFHELPPHQQINIPVVRLRLDPTAYRDGLAVLPEDLARRLVKLEEHFEQKSRWRTDPLGLMVIFPDLSFRRLGGDLRSLGFWLESVGERIQGLGDRPANNPRRIYLKPD